MVLPQSLHRKGVSKEHILELYTWIGWGMKLLEELVKKVVQELAALEKEIARFHISRAQRFGNENRKRLGIEKGRKWLRQEGRRIDRRETSLAEGERTLRQGSESA